MAHQPFSRLVRDPLFELMMVLGIWAKYYETIPREMRKVGDTVQALSTRMTESLESRLKRLQTLAQAIQKAIDQLEDVPQAIVERFPSEELARSIAGKIDRQMNDLPLMEGECLIRHLENQLRVFLGEDAKDNYPAVKGLAVKMQEDLARLQRSAEDLSRMKLPDRASVLRDLAFALLGGAIVWLFGNYAILRDIRDEFQKQPSMNQQMKTRQTDP